MIAGPQGLEESPSRAERGRLVKAREAAQAVDSPDWRTVSAVREQQKPFRFGLSGVQNG